MPTSETSPGSIVRVPFPYTDADARQRRPALVVAATGPGGDNPLLLWTLMVTSAEHRRWQGDVEIPDFAAAGLPIPSVIRTARIATIDLDRAEAIGRVRPETLAAVRAELRLHLGV